jgi:two-component sensor histidine kinase
VFVEVSAACILYRGKPASLAYFRDVTERNTAEAQARASLAEKEVLLKEIHHRVKNNLQIVSSLLYLQSRVVDDAKTLEALNESQNRIKSMALVHDALYRSFDVAHIDMTEYVSSLVRHLTNSYQREDIPVNVSVDVAHVSFPIDMAVPCGLIVNELVSNALKHAFKTRGDNRVGVALGSADGKFVLSVTDNGVGLSAELDVTQSPSLGLQLVCVLVDQIDGTMEVMGDDGTAFIITFG